MKTRYNQTKSKSKDAGQTNTDAADQDKSGQEADLPEDVVGLQQLLGFGDYQPTALQVKLVYAYLHHNPEQLSPTRLLTKLGHSRTIWYHWRKTPGFLKWFNEVIDSGFSDKLPQLYSALFARAVHHDTAAAKLYIERYDEDYKPQSKTDNKHEFAGFLPPVDAEYSRRMEREITSQLEQALTHSDVIDVEPERRADVSPADKLRAELNQKELERMGLSDDTYVDVPGGEGARGVPGP